MTLTIPVFARLLEKDFRKNWRHIFTVINEFFWAKTPAEKAKILAEPEVKEPVILAICASLAEWLAEQEGLPRPAWTKNVAPSPKAVYFLPEEAKALAMKAFIKSPVSFRKRHVFIASLSDYAKGKSDKPPLEEIS